MGAFEAIKRGAATFKDALAMIAVIFAFNFVSAFAMLMIVGVNPTPERVTEASVPMGILFLLMALAWIFITGGLLSSSQSVLKTGNLNMGEFAGNGSKHFLRLLILNIIYLFVIVVCWLAGAFLVGVFVAFGGGDNVFFNILGVIFLLLTIIAVAILSMPLVMSQYCLVKDDGNARDSLAQAFGLFWKNFWRTFGFFLLLMISVVLVSSLVKALTTLLGNAMPGMAAAVINITLTSISNGAIGVFMAVCIMTYVLGISETSEPQIQQ
jgi:hypothetical protein